MSEAILLIEDSPAQAAVYKAYLEGEGYSVVMAGSGEEGLRALEERAVAAVLLDLQLPGIGGFEVLERLRRRSSRIPVVVVTDYGSAENASEAVRLGAADFVTKPFDRGRLKVTIGNAIRQGQLATMVDKLQEKFSRDRFHRFVGGSAPCDGVHHG